MNQSNKFQQMHMHFINILKSHFKHGSVWMPVQNMNILKGPYEFLFYICHIIVKQYHVSNDLYREYHASNYVFVWNSMWANVIFCYIYKTMYWLFCLVLSTTTTKKIVIKPQQKCCFSHQYTGAMYLWMTGQNTIEFNCMRHMCILAT